MPVESEQSHSTMQPSLGTCIGFSVGLVSGILNGALNEGGPPVVIYLAVKRWHKDDQKVSCSHVRQPSLHRPRPRITLINA